MQYCGVFHMHHRAFRMLFFPHTADKLNSLPEGHRAANIDPEIIYVRQPLLRYGDAHQALLITNVVA